MKNKSNKNSHSSTSLRQNEKSEFFTLLFARRSKKNILLIISLFVFYIAIPFTFCFAIPGGTTNPDGTITYVPLEKTAMDAADINSTGNLADFLKSVYNFGVAAAAVLAVLMIAWGGIEYMTTEAFQGKSDAKDKIWNAIFGLLLVLASYLILWTINPDIIKLPGSSLF